MKQNALKSRYKRILCLCLIACLLLAACFTVTVSKRHASEMTYYDAVLNAAAAYHVSPALIMAVIRAESGFCQTVRSSKGAVGLMQLMPDTFAYLRDTHFKESLPDDAILSPTVNIRYGTFYLSYLLQAFGSLDTALAAYNAGEGRVAAWLNDKALSSDGKTLTTIPYPETAKYVSKTKEYYHYYIKKFRLKEQV